MGIEYTEDQKEIVDYLYEQIIDENGTNVVVSGSGGTGKTTMICEFIATLIQQNYRVAVTAMTGKATAVLRTKIYSTLSEKGLNPNKKQLTVETVSKITKTSKVVGIDQNGQTIFSNVWNDPLQFRELYDVLFVDELSMVPQYISQWWAASGIRVFGFGDECQLPEVCTKETKEEISRFKHDLKLPDMKFVSGYGIKVLKGLAQKQLHKVLRSDNEIALLCNELRDFTQSKTQFIGRIKDWAAKTENIKYSTSIKDVPNTNDWQLLCFTNKMCKQINDQRAIGEEYPDAMDKIILGDNLNIMKKYNGDIITFKELVFLSEYYRQKTKSPVYICMRWGGKMPRPDSKNAHERQFFLNYKTYKTTIGTALETRIMSLKTIVSNSGFASGLKAEVLNMVQELYDSVEDKNMCFLMIMENIEKENLELAQLIMSGIGSLPQLYMVSANFGYGITVHKSQGSEYKKVCYVMEKFDKSLAYTAISRAREQLMVIDLTK